MSYKQNAAANRDALFGPSSSFSKKKSSSSTGPKYKQDAASNRDALFGGASSSGKSKKSSSSTSRVTSAAAAVKATVKSSTGYNYGNHNTTNTMSSSMSSRVSSTSRTTSTDKKKSPITSVLSGTAKMEKLKQAEEYRQKAKKAMTRSVFSRPDPIMAGTFYKRAADAYQACGDENRLERLHRIASGDCQMGQGAYGSAAGEYLRAAELVQISEETPDRKMKEGWKLYSDAANAYTQMGEKGKAAKCRLQSALAYTWNDDDDEGVEPTSSKVLSKKALECVEEAVEAHVPDPLNRYARYRQTGTSAYMDPNSDSATAKTADTPTFSKQTMELAMNALVTTPFAHEPLIDLVSTLVSYREYTTALYAAGAASKLLEADGIATISLDRIYCIETILLCAMGDVIQAEQVFLNVHVQHTSYLSSRECKLSEDLFRAIKMRDADALEEARSPQGSNRACLANLRTHTLRTLVQELRLNGMARPVTKKKKPKAKKDTTTRTTTITPSANDPMAAATPEWTGPIIPTATAPPLVPATVLPPSTSLSTVPAQLNNNNNHDDKLEEPEEYDANALHNEMDDLMTDMGLDGLSSDDDDEDEEDLSDDDIDLR